MKSLAAHNQSIDLILSTISPSIKFPTSETEYKYDVN